MKSCNLILVGFKPGYKKVYCNFSVEETALKGHTVVHGILSKKVYNMQCPLCFAFFSEIVQNVNELFLFLAFRNLITFTLHLWK